MRLLVARCAVEYQGRLGARLAPATRLILFKADGSIAVHSDAKAYKPLNWMNPPCAIDGADGVITARTPKGETLRIEVLEVAARHDDRRSATIPASRRTASKPSCRSCSPRASRRCARTAR